MGGPKPRLHTCQPRKRVGRHMGLFELSAVEVWNNFDPNDKQND